MKRRLLPLLPALFVLSAQAEERYLSVTTNTWITLGPGQAIEYVSGINGNATIYNNGASEIPFAVFDGPWANTITARARAVLAGPCKLNVGFNPNTQGGFATFRIFPDTESPAKTLVLSPTTNAVTVHLESSTNLVDWSVAASVTLTNVPTATFYRSRLE